MTFLLFSGAGSTAKQILVALKSDLIDWMGKKIAGRNSWKMICHSGLRSFVSYLGVPIFLGGSSQLVRGLQSQLEVTQVVLDQST